MVTRGRQIRLALVVLGIIAVLPPTIAAVTAPGPTPSGPLSARIDPYADAGTLSSAAIGAPQVAVGSRPGPTVVAVPPGLLPGSVGATSIDLRAEYDATVHLNYGTRAFTVDSTMTVTNTSSAAVDRLELNTIAARLGGLKITAATSAGKPVNPTVSDQTIRFPLGGILGVGQTVQARIAYSASLRATTTGSDWLFTRANGIVDAHRWLPWISAPLPFDRPNHGDPFVTPVSPRVRVTVVSDRALVFATTGEQTTANGLTKSFEATNVRDFAFTAAPDYASSSAVVGGVTLRVFGRPGFPRSAVLAATTTAFSKEAALLGPYPYATYDVAQTAGGYGMESPGLTLIPTGVATSNLPYLIAHETGHQWFYGIVGNDQANEPFADEAMTDFIARYALGLRRASRCSTARLDLSIYRYSSACYYEVIYIQGGNLVDDTRKAMGSTAFWAGIRDYLAANRFRIANEKGLLDTLDAHTSLNLAARFAPRFPRLY
jgi:hypothetical protein